MNPVYIVDSIRTPRARANQKGGLSKLNPYELLDILYKDIKQKNFLDLHSIDDDKLNVNGGCIALGHPMGATGSIMMSTLVDELERQDLSTGIVATSGAAGAGTAILIERI